MASTLQVVLFTALALCCVDAQLSIHIAETMIEYVDTVESAVSFECFRHFRNVFTKEGPVPTDVDFGPKVCNDIAHMGQVFIGNCTTDEYILIKDKICDLIKQSAEDRIDRVIHIAIAITKQSSTCQQKIKPYTLDTWFDIEKLCTAMTQTDKEDFERSCPKDEYSDMKGAVCGGGASSLLSGLVTLTLCFLASLSHRL